MVENKKDLLTEEQILESEDFLKSYANENEFDCYFRASAKTGENVQEAINFLIIKIIERFDNMKADDYEQEGPRNSITLVAEHHTKQNVEKNRDKNENCC